MTATMPIDSREAPPVHAQPFQALAVRAPIVLVAIAIVTGAASAGLTVTTLLAEHSAQAPAWRVSGIMSDDVATLAGRGQSRIVSATEHRNAPDRVLQEGWTRIDVGPSGGTAAFSISLPPGWTYQPLMGIDSFVGEFTGDGMTLGFDYGMYSFPIADPGDRGYDVTFERISCSRAKIVDAVEAPAQYTGIYFASVRNRGLHFPSVRLQVSGIGFDAAQRALVLRIVRTIRFDDVCLHGGGGHWSTEALPIEGMSPEDIDLVPPDQGWAVGRREPSGERPEQCGMIRLEDSIWIESPCPSDDPMVAVSMASTELGWAVGGESILRWADERWAVYSDTLGTELFDIAVTALDDGSVDGWIVGDGMVLRLRDGTWHPADTGLDFDPSVISIAASGAVLAAFGASLATFEDGTWTGAALPFDDVRITAIDATGPDRAWLVGDAGPDSGTVVRVLAPGIFDRNPILGSRTIWDVVDLGRFDGGSGVWAVGGGSWAGPGEVLHHDGSGWSRLEAPFDGYLKAVDFFSPDEGWAVGARLSDDGSVHGILMHLLPDVIPLGPTPTIDATASASVTPSTPPTTGSATPTPAAFPTASATATEGSERGPSTIFLPYSSALMPDGSEGVE